MLVVLIALGIYSLMASFLENIPVIGFLFEIFSVILILIVLYFIGRVVFADVEGYYEETSEWKDYDNPLKEKYKEFYENEKPKRTRKRNSGTNFGSPRQTVGKIRRGRARIKKKFR